jgi:hypothetical protein
MPATAEAERTLGFLAEESALEVASFLCAGASSSLETDLLFLDEPALVAAFIFFVETPVVGSSLVLFGVASALDSVLSFLAEDLPTPEAVFSFVVEGLAVPEAALIFFASGCSSSDVAKSSLSRAY